MHPFTPFTTLPNPSPNSGKEIIYSLYLWMFYFVLFHFLSWQRIHLHCRRPQFYSWFGKIHWRRDRLPTVVFLGFPVAQLVKNQPAMQETWIWSLGWEDPLEKGIAIHSSILALRIPWTVWSMGLQKVGHDWTAFTFTKYHRPCLEAGREPQTS